MITTKNSVQWKYPKYWVALACLTIFALLLTGCAGIGAPQPKTYTIGIANESHNQDAVMEGFKASMTELGYVEGKNITYIYHEVLGTEPSANDAEIKNLLDQKVDLLVTLGTAPSAAAKKAVEGTNIPVVFCPVLDPVNEKLVASINHPGGNLTGVQTINTTPKMMEWLLKIAPSRKHIYAPYNPADKVALRSVESLPDMATQMGINLELGKVNKGDEALAAIKTLPEDSSILLTSSPSLNSSIEAILDLAIALHFPTASRTRIGEGKVLLTYTTEVTKLGKQAAILVDKVFKGAKPGDLPIETAEFVVTINLQVAEKIGLQIPDEVLQQADKIVR